MAGRCLTYLIRQNIGSEILERQLQLFEAIVDGYFDGDERICRHRVGDRSRSRHIDGLLQESCAGAALGMTWAAMRTGGSQLCYPGAAEPTTMQASERVFVMDDPTRLKQSITSSWWVRRWMTVREADEACCLLYRRRIGHAWHATKWGSGSVTCTWRNLSTSPVQEPQALPTAATRARQNPNTSPRECLECFPIWSNRSPKGAMTSGLVISRFNPHPSLGLLGST